MSKISLMSGHGTALTAMVPKENDEAFSMGNIIDLQFIRKRYGTKLALDGVDLSVRHGEILGYVGPNGAGKSTTLRIIVGLDRKYEGELFFDGDSRNTGRKHLSEIGYMPQAISFAGWRTVAETIYLLGRLSGLDGQCLDRRISQVLEFADLKDAIHLPCSALSGGMTQRLGLAQALLHEPRLVILDEPFNQLDPIGRTQLKQMILTLKRNGVSVLFSSHILSDVEELADRVAVINRGKILFQGRLDELRDQHDCEVVFILGLAESAGPPDLARHFPEVSSVTELRPGLYKVAVQPQSALRQEDVAPCFLEALVRSGLRIKEFRCMDTTLDELFSKLVGGQS